MRRERAAGVGLVAAGVVLGAAGAGVVSVGTGAFGLDTTTFTRIECSSTVVEKGGTVWHCFGESPAQVRANAKPRRHTVLRAHVDGVPPFEPRQRTRLSFVDHDGQRDPQRVTASRVGGRWIAHSGNVVGIGVLVTVGGCAVAAWGGYRFRRR